MIRRQLNLTEMSKHCTPSTKHYAGLKEHWLKKIGKQKEIKNTH